MSENLTIQAPDFARIKRGDGRATADAINLLWLALNDEMATRRRQRAIWLDVPFNAANFGASAGTWTVESADQQVFKTIFTGNLQLVSLVLVDTSTSSGMGTGLTVVLPLGLSAGAGSMVGLVAVGGTITELALVSTQAAPNGAVLLLERADGSAWPSSVTNDLDLQLFLALAVG